MRKLILLAAVAGCMMLAGCGQQDTPATASSATAAPPSAPPPIARTFTRNDWVSTFESTFSMKKPTQDGEGITEYLACFQEDSSKRSGCSLFAFGRTDAFNKLSSLTTAHSRFADVADINTFVKVVVVAIECQSPKLVLMPRFNAKGGWLFMDRVAILADGELALEHSFENHDVSRDNGYSWVSEKATWITDEKDMRGIQAILAAKKTIGRVSGSKGYVTIKKDLQDGFIDDLRDAVSIMGRLTAAYVKAGGAHCTQ